MSESTPSRSRYHHGDLRQALLDAGTGLAADGGPDAVVLREATRRVGVSPNAAYRHFADREALLGAVSDRALGMLAEEIEREDGRIDETLPVGEVARARLRAVGTAYVRFALDHPALFRTAFSVPENLETSSAPAKAGPGGRTPLQLLTHALDSMVDCGIMPVERRPQAEFLAWSSVHGFAMLSIDGPLRAVPLPAADAVVQRVVDMVEAGLTA